MAARFALAVSELGAAWPIVAVIAVLVALIGFGLGRLSGQAADLLGKRLMRVGLAIGGVVLGVAVVVIWLNYGDRLHIGARHVGTSAVAEVGAGLTLIFITFALWRAGSDKSVAGDAFYVRDDNAAEIKLKPGDQVPEALKKPVEDEGALGAEVYVTAPITFWSGGETADLAIGNPVPDEALDQAGGRVEFKWVANEDVTFPDPDARRFTLPKDAVVSGTLAALPEFKDRTRQHVVATERFEYDSAGRHVVVEKGAELLSAEAQTAAGDHKETRTIAIEDVTYPDPDKPRLERRKEAVVEERFRNLKELAGKTRQQAFALAAIRYRTGATKHALATGDKLDPDDDASRGAAGDNLDTRPVATKDFAIHARVYDRGQVVPAGDAAKNAAHVRRVHGTYLRNLVMGHDGRWSTSKSQALMWTYIVLFVLLALVYANVTLGEHLSTDAGTDTSKNGLIDFSEIDLPGAYYILLGGPFAAAILAKAFTSRKVEDGTLVKPDATTSNGIVDIVSNDSAQTDVVDFQYFLFNLLAAAFVVITFVPALKDGFPDVPEILFGLTGASALAYTAKKAADRSVAVITSVSPRLIRGGDVLDIWGRNFVVGAGQLPRVTVGGLDAGTPEVVVGGPRDVDHLRVTVPKDLHGQPRVNVVVTPDGGTATEPVEVDVDTVAITSVTPEPIVLSSTPRLAIAGRGLADAGDVTLGGLPLTVMSHDSGQIVATLDSRVAYPAGSDVLLEVHVGPQIAVRTVSVEMLRIDHVRPLPLPRKADQDIVIDGGGLGVTPLSATLDGEPLDVVSQTDNIVVARMRAQSIQDGKYAVSTSATLELQHGIYRQSAGVTIVAG